MDHNSRTVIASVLNGRSLLEHPFYRRWEEGRLVDGELTAYAEQYRFFETALPGFLAELANSLAGAARDAVTENLADETASPSHLELFGGFASFYGASDTTISPAMAALLDAYRTNAATSPASALGGVLAYEAQGAAIADTKAEGLARHYGANEDALTFWRTHAGLENDHATWLFDATDAYAADEDFASGARRVADAWWAFLDERELLVAA